MKPSNQLKQLERQIITSSVISIFDIRKSLNDIIKNVESIESKTKNYVKRRRDIQEQP